MVGLLDKYHFIPATAEHAQLHNMAFDDFSICGITAVKEGKIAAVCTLSEWTESSCSIHMVVLDQWVFKNGYLEEVFNFIFCESGRSVVIATVRSDNAQLKRFVNKVGFKRVGVIPDGYKVGVDYEINVMLKKHCRYITNGIPFTGRTESTGLRSASSSTGRG